LQQVAGVEAANQAAFGADDAVRDAVLEAQRVAQRQHQVAALHLVAVGERDLHHVVLAEHARRRRRQVHHRQVGQRIGVDAVVGDGDAVAAVEGNPQTVGVLHDVVVRQQPVGFDDTAGAGGNEVEGFARLGVVDFGPVLAVLDVRVAAVGEAGEADDAGADLADHVAEAERDEVDALVEQLQVFVGGVGLGAQLGAALGVGGLGVGAALDIAPTGHQHRRAKAPIRKTSRKLVRPSSSAARPRLAWTGRATGSVPASAGRLFPSPGGSGPGRLRFHGGWGFGPVGVHRWFSVC